MRYAASSPARIVREQEEHARVVREEEVQALRQKKARTARRAAPDTEHSRALARRGAELEALTQLAFLTPSSMRAVASADTRSSSRTSSLCFSAAASRPSRNISPELLSRSTPSNALWYIAGGKVETTQPVKDAQLLNHFLGVSSTEAEQPTVSTSATMQQPFEKKEAATPAPAPVCTFPLPHPSQPSAWSPHSALPAHTRRFPAKWTSNSSWTPLLGAQLAARQQSAFPMPLRTSTRPPCLSFRSRAGGCGARSMHGGR
ncbi:hypothetical protein B0H14DRAFT_2720986 [Mycena olivaceomarginata]|nr:hypothetical protein B0H14DRAFT_2720986 [Mycena olivaceomarginata]